MIRHENFLKPRYDQGGFASLPGRIQSLIPRYDAVVLFLVDGFGWRFIEKFQHAPFLASLMNAGTTERLTSQFPSTTAAHITCIHTGLPVGQHGIYEWTIFDPGLDAVITPLLFSFGGTQERDQLSLAGVDPGRLYPQQTVYQRMAAKGVSSFIFQHREYTPSTYSNAVFNGATASGYRTLPEMFYNFGEALKKQPAPAYYFLYFDRIDTLSHEYGPDSPQVEAEIEAFLLLAGRFLLPALQKSGRRVLFMLTADHGQSETDPATTIYLNMHPAFAGIERAIKRTQKGELIVPAGSPRDMFLHIKDDMLDEVKARLEAGLTGKAEVHTTEALISNGYFGENTSELFRSRAGNLVVLPYRYESVWWYEKGRYEQKYYGHHGGLTRQEMEIGLISTEI